MFSKSTICLLTVGACDAALSLDDDVLLQHNLVEESPPDFKSFIELHSRSYKSGDNEYERRQAIFEEEVERVASINSQTDRLWTAGINHMSDWTKEEFHGLLGWRGHARNDGGHETFLLQSGASKTDSENHLWEDHMVGEAADQGSCGSCWAVATAKMLEVNFRIHTGANRSFSAQQLIDCTPNPMSCGGDGGCKGATVELALAQASEHGLATKEDIPYHAKDLKCTNNKGKILIVKDTEEKGLSMKKLNTPDFKWTKGGAFKDLRLQYWQRLTLNSGEALKAALMKGTVAVSVDASDWNRYRNGIFDACSKDAAVNHAVVAVGFGKDSAAKYWTIMNSWGPIWGEKGRIRLLRTDEKYCGTDYQPQEGTACKGGPSSVKVCGMCGLFYDNVFAQFA